MFLKKITLKNFKCLEDIELSFEKNKSANRQWTLILGENGTGKSNLLKAIALVTSGSNAISELLGDTDTWIRNGQDQCSITAILTTADRQERNIKLELTKGATLFDIISTNKQALQLIDSAVEKADRNYFVVAFGASRRLSSEIFLNLEKSTSRRYFNVRNLFYNQYPLTPLTSWIMDLDYRTGEKGLNIVRDTLNDFLPGTQFKGVDKERKRVLFDTEDGIMPLDQLSDGYQNMAAWIGDLLYRITENFRDYERPLEARGLLLIDEVDLHLHPKWQRKLIKFISKKLPNFQIVATTHSPLTAQQAGEGELYALKRTSNHKIQLLAFEGSPKSLLVNQLLMTPVFGLETDESLDMEQTKNEYDRLKSVDNLTLNQEKEFNAIKSKLKKNLPKRIVPGASSIELDLLNKINVQLNLQKKQ